MPSRCANTGTRASSCTRATRLLPPRGTITSMAPSRPFEHQADRLAVGGRHELDGGFGQARRAQAARQARLDGAARVVAVRAAAQDRGVAGLEAQRAGVGRHVRPALVDDADDAERHAHALDVEAVGPRPAAPSRCRPDRAARRSPPAPWPWPRCAWGRASGGRGRTRGRPASRGGGQVALVGVEDGGGLRAQLARAPASSAAFLASVDASASSRAAARAWRPSARMAVGSTLALQRLAAWSSVCHVLARQALLSTMSSRCTSSARPA